MRVCDINSNDRPRERLKLLGPTSLSDAELLALILRSGSKNNNIISQSQSILSRHPLCSLQFASLQELLLIKGVGIAKASQILAIFELARRAHKKDILEINSQEQAKQYASNLISHFEQEHFLVIWLNNKNHVLGHEITTKGLVNECIVHPREVFRGAIKANASRIIIAHNHPSKDCTPSQEDEAVTKALKRASDILNIELLDHVIV